MNKQDIFYKLPEGSEESILRECIQSSFAVFIDKHDSDEYGKRKRYDISIDECFELFRTTQKNMHWVFINRKNKCFWDDSEDVEYWEVGGCTLGEPDGDVFLFINMRTDNGNKIKEKYDLKLLMS